MEGQAIGLRNGEKGKEGLSPAFVKNSRGAQKGTGLGYLGITKAKGILRECRRELVRIWTAQESMLMDTRNEDSMSH